MNGDRFPELLWVSDFGQSRYFVNNGNGSFSNATAGSGVGLDGNGMGTAVADFNGDGRPDWFVTSIYNTTPYPNQPGTGNMLYMNQGAHQFSEVSQSSGVKRAGVGGDRRRYGQRRARRHRAHQRAFITAGRSSTTTRPACSGTSARVRSRKPLRPAA